METRIAGGGPSGRKARRMPVNRHCTASTACRQSTMAIGGVSEPESHIPVAYYVRQSECTAYVIGFVFASVFRTVSPVVRGTFWLGYSCLTTKRRKKGHNLGNRNGHAVGYGYHYGINKTITHLLSTGGGECGILRHKASIFETIYFSMT